MPDPQSDWELLNEYRRGNQRAATELFRRHYPRVVKTFSGVSTPDADDLLQDTFLAAFSVTEDKVTSGDFGAYVVGISRKKLASYFSKTSRKKLMVEITEDEPLVSDYVIAKRQDRVLLEALRKLDTTYQQVILLRYAEATYPEIASLLNIPIGTVRSRLSRGKAELERALAKLEKSAHRFDSTATTIMSWAQNILSSLEVNERTPE